MANIHFHLFPMQKAKLAAVWWIFQSSGLEESPGTLAALISHSCIASPPSDSSCCPLISDVYSVLIFSCLTRCLLSTHLDELAVPASVRSPHSSSLQLLLCCQDREAACTAVGKVETDKPYCLGKGPLLFSPCILWVYFEISLLTPEMFCRLTSTFSITFRIHEVARSLDSE